MLNRRVFSHLHLYMIQQYDPIANMICEYGWTSVVQIPPLRSLSLCRHN